MTSNISNEHEAWRPVVGYEGLYEVSDMGRVRSVDRLVWRDGAQYSKPHRIPKPGRIKAAHIQKLGYVGVMLWKNGRVSNLRVHRLVLEAFVGPAPDDMETLHGNGVRHDNRLVNLRWGTRQENIADKVRHRTASQAGRVGGGNQHQDKSHCKRGHALQGPNLRERILRATGRPARSCISCDRAWANLRWLNPAKQPGREEREAWLQARSNQHYAAIMTPPQTSANPAV